MKGYTISCWILLFTTYCYGQENSMPAKIYPGVAVVELFTSQSDINSPAADKILNDIIVESEKNNQPVYCIAMHVDFWNRFGWKDPFSSFQYTNRLKNYSSVFGDKEIYTPFLIVNGTKKIEASNVKQLKNSIAETIEEKIMYDPEISFSIFDDTLDINYDIKQKLTRNKSGSDKYLNIVIVEKKLSTEVTKGDNAGKTLYNDNTSRLFKTFDLNNSNDLVRIALKGLKPSANKTLIVFIQDKKTRKVLGASQLPFNK